MAEKQANQAEWVTFTPGGRRRVIVDGEKLMNVEVTLDKGTIVAAHKLIHEQSTYIISGEVEFTIEGQMTLLKAGQSILIPSDATHGVTALERSLVIDTFSPPREDFRQK